MTPLSRPANHDDADNMLTKVEPFFDYVNKDTSVSNYRLMVNLRITSGGEKLMLAFYPADARLVKYVGGAWSMVDQDTNATTTQDETYHVRAVCDGSSITVWRWQDGELPAEILSGTVNDVSTTTTLDFVAQPYSVQAVDNIRVLSDSLSNTASFTANSANQVTAMNDFNGATSFSYDPWGRMTKKNVSTTYTANYYYNYGSKLTKASSNFPGEGTVDYSYGGDQKRRLRTVGGTSTWYNWGVGWSVLNEESGTGSGTLQKTYVRRMAEIAGSNPATGTYSYYATDNLGSPRAVYSQAKALVAELDFTPHGQAYTANDTVGITHRYTGHDWDAAANLYFAPYRFYSPQVARWMSRDPLGFEDGPNLYSYVGSNPIQNVDPLGGTIRCWGDKTNKKWYAWCKKRPHTSMTTCDGEKYCCIRIGKDDPCEKCFSDYDRRVRACLKKPPAEQKACIDDELAKAAVCVADKC